MFLLNNARLTLEISIDLDDPYKLSENYLYTHFNGISRKKKINDNNIQRVNSLFGIKKKIQKFKNEIDNLLLEKQKTITNFNKLNENGI